jgi:hypothetical protein
MTTIEISFNVIFSGKEGKYGHLSGMNKYIKFACKINTSASSKYEKGDNFNLFK